MQSPIEEAAYGDCLAANNSRFRMRATAGAPIGWLRAQTSLNHTHGYLLDPPGGLAPLQTRIASFDVVDLIFRYHVDLKGAFTDFSTMLNINDILDRDAQWADNRISFQRVLVMPTGLPSDACLNWASASGS